MELVRKITVKQVAGKIDIEQVLAAPNKTLKLARIYGMASKARPDQSDMGAFLRFSGRFRAQNFVDGTLYESGALILPGIAQDALAGALDGANGGAVEFAFEISAKYDKEAVTKYVYQVTPLFETSQDDPLERMGRKVAAIAAPKDEEKATEKVEASTKK